MERIIFWIIMGAIVAFIANKQGRSGFGWFLYGFLIWPVALIHVLVTRPDNVKPDKRAGEDDI